jgi:hypothetical protein
VKSPVLETYAKEDAVLVVAGGIAATALIALNLRPDPGSRAEPACPRRLAVSARVRLGRG